MRVRADLHGCQQCPRLLALRHQVADAHPDYHAAPVAGWGSRRARLLIVGLAPGMHGANRTGRPFTGDASGAFLFAALYRAGLASQPDANRAALSGTRITNAVKCLPPGNRPDASEFAACRPFLQEELQQLLGQHPRRARVILCLGGLAHDAVVRALGSVGTSAFRHGQCVSVSSRVWLQDSYHPSRLNTQTGRLTAGMLDEVLATTTALLRSADLPQ